MTTHRKVILVALATLIMTPASYGWGQIYKVIDGENGVVFTDKPSVMDNSSNQSVEEVELKETNTAAPVQVRPPSTTNSNSSPESQAVENPTVKILSPPNESTVAMGPGNFSVSASASPALSAGERLILLIDGVAQGEPQSSGTWFIEGALRGPHDLVVQRTTTRGKMIAASDPVKIYVLRPSIR
jgi:hypothetical protein